MTTLDEIYKLSPFKQGFYNKTFFEKEREDVYGEVTKEYTEAIINQFKDYFNENTCFYDLGSGLGKMVVHIGLELNPKKSVGIEFSKERYNGSMFLKETYCKDNENIQFFNGSFFDINFSDATVIYCDNTMFSNKTDGDIFKLIPKGCLFICKKSSPLLPDKINFESINDIGARTSYLSSKIVYFIKE